jgi:hypothetical protein
MFAAYTWFVALRNFCTSKNLLGLCEGAHREREVHHAELLDDAGQRRGRGCRHLLHAPLQGRLLLHLVAELRRRELLHLQLAATLCREQLGEALDAEVHGVVRVVEMAAVGEMGGTACGASMRRRRDHRPYVEKISTNENTWHRWR